MSYTFRGWEAQSERPVHGEGLTVVSCHNTGKDQGDKGAETPASGTPSHNRGLRAPMRTQSSQPSRRLEVTLSALGAKE